MILPVLAQEGCTDHIQGVPGYELTCVRPFTPVSITDHVRADFSQLISATGTTKGPYRDVSIIRRREP